jgi:hypothetical protein
MSLKTILAALGVSIIALTLTACATTQTNAPPTQSAETEDSADDNPRRPRWSNY